MLLRRLKILMLAGVLLTACGTMAQAAPPNTLDDAPTKADAKASGASMAGVAVVDMTRLYNASGAAAEYERKIGEVTSDAQQRIKAIEGVSLLVPAELQEYITLAGKAEPKIGRAHV